MARQKTTTEELYAAIKRSDTGLGGGKLSFQLVCQHCQNHDDIEAKKSTIQHPGFIRRAAMAFTKKGWSFADGPVCPTCGQASA